MNQLPNNFECNGEHISDKSDIANEFNTLFSTVGSNLANALPDIDVGVSIYDYLGPHNPNSMFLNPVSINEVINIVKTCKPKNSKDCDGLSMYIVSSHQSNC